MIKKRRRCRMILLLTLLLALPILGLIAVLAVPLVGVLAALAVPAIVLLAVLAAPALAIAALAGAFSTANISVPVLGTLEVLGIAVGMFGLVAALAYVADRLASRAPVPALRRQEVPVGARERVTVAPRRQAVVGMASQTIRADSAAQCQEGQLAPCPA
jgi:hypothetical protein